MEREQEVWQKNSSRKNWKIKKCGLKKEGDRRKSSDHFDKLQQLGRTLRLKKEAEEKSCSLTNCTESCLIHDLAGHVGHVI